MPMSQLSYRDAFPWMFLAVAVAGCGDEQGPGSTPDARATEPADAAAETRDAEPLPVDASNEIVTLTVNRSGDGGGTVFSEPWQIRRVNETTYEALMSSGGQTTLTPIVSPDSVFVGWEGGGCEGTDPCTVEVVEDTIISARFDLGHNLVFVTSAPSSGELGGLEGADAHCQQLADDAGLDGTYRAWLSSSAVDARDRLIGSRGWMRVDRKLVADTVADLVEGRILHPIRIDELGNDIGLSDVYTGTGTDGAVQSFTCEDWTAAAGFGGVGNSAFGGVSFGMGPDGSGTSCSLERPLYCFGIDHDLAVLPPTPSDDRFAFITTASWTPAGGIGSADALCQSEAALSALPGTYKALLATTEASPASRFDTAAAPWRRVDGVRITETAEAMFQAGRFDSFLNLTADGQTYYSSSTFVWSGTGSLAEAGAANQTCNDWQPSAGDRGLGGLVASSELRLFLGSDEVSQDCGANVIKLACLQE